MLGVLGQHFNFASTFFCFTISCNASQLLKVQYEARLIEVELRASKEDKDANKTGFKKMEMRPCIFIDKAELFVQSKYSLQRMSGYQRVGFSSS